MHTLEITLLQSIESLVFLSQTSQAELQKVKAELANVKKDKNSLQAKVAELKGALRASVQHATVSFCYISRSSHTQLSLKLMHTNCLCCCFIQAFTEP